MKRSSSSHAVEYVIACMQLFCFERSYRFIYYGMTAKEMVKKEIPADYPIQKAITAYTVENKRLESSSAHIPDEEDMIRFFKSLSPDEHRILRENPDILPFETLRLLIAKTEGEAKTNLQTLLSALIKWEKEKTEKNLTMSEKSQNSEIVSKLYSGGDTLKESMAHTALFAETLKHEYVSVKHGVDLSNNAIEIIKTEISEALDAGVFYNILNGNLLSHLMFDYSEYITKMLIYDDNASLSMVQWLNEFNNDANDILMMIAQIYPFMEQPSWTIKDYHEAVHFLDNEFGFPKIFQPLELEKVKDNPKHPEAVYSNIFRLYNNAENIKRSSVEKIITDIIRNKEGSHIIFPRKINTKYPIRKTSAVHLKRGNSLDPVSRSVIDPPNSPVEH
ncbi:MAG: hypothetical protein E7662_10965 [Ruminococcaceae bacterium]|nr:hypothetical protein [Oscillospiraceae bacterium]